MSLLDEIEPLKAEALAELNAAADQAALDQAKGKWLGPQGRFTGLMKQLGALPKGDRPCLSKCFWETLSCNGCRRGICLNGRKSKNRNRSHGSNTKVDSKQKCIVLIVSKT